MATWLRLEFNTGEGIYASCNDNCFEIREIIKSEYGTCAGPRHPTPYNDTLLDRNLTEMGLTASDCRYGFSSEEQFRAWFPSDEMLKKFSDLGVQLVQYEVPTLIPGNSQACVPSNHYDDGEIEELFRVSLRDYLDGKHKGVDKI